MLTNKTKKYFNRSKRQFLTGLLLLPIATAIWVLTRPPATPTSAAEDIFGALESGNARRLYGFLLLEEQRALGLTRTQSEQILSEVIIPAFRNLNVRTSEKKFLPGAYEMYFMAPCKLNSTDAHFTLGILELTPRHYQTSLTYLYSGIVITEVWVGKQSGTENQIRDSQRARFVKLKSLGLKGLYNFNKGTVAEWPKSKS